MLPCVDLTNLCHLAILAISALIWWMKGTKFSIFYQLSNDGFMISFLENATIIATKHFQNEATFSQK